MGTIGEAVRRRRSALRTGLTGRILDLGLLIIVAVFLLFLGQRIIAEGPSFFLQILTFALANGGIYALIALGYTMVYGIIELINFAHGDVFAFGAFGSLWLMERMDANMADVTAQYNNTLLAVATIAASMLFAAIICAVLGVLIDRIAYRPLRN